MSDAPAAAAAAANTQAANVPDHVVTLEVDDEDDRSEVGVQSIASSSTSVSSSILDYRIENGRTYHRYKDGKYTIPNDERETDRLDMQHHLFLLTYDDKLGTAPIHEPGRKVGRVLDVGTGTGIWAIDFGEEHPEAEVLGIDLSAIQPEFTPPNVKFEIDDLEEPWTYSRPFDYIHSRMMNACVADWGEYIKRCYDNLNPGGYLELNEWDAMPLSDDGTLGPDSYTAKALPVLMGALEDMGRPFVDVKTLKSVMIEAGFVDVTMTQFKWPQNPWPKETRHKEIAYWANQNLNDGLEAVFMAPLARRLEWTREEVLVFLVGLRKEINNRSIHSYISV
ncbi:hypothetical protein COL154_013689 [Colletotrichum chrysophilum]|nr:hypothetical protein COL154_013689 [Colletotrichum chrysophilum]